MHTNISTEWCHLVISIAPDSTAIEIEATKKEKDAFDKSLEEIRQDLNNGDWTLAELSCQRVMKEYDDLVRKEWVVAEEKEINPEENKSKDTEKKIMLTWKDGGMSVEEVKDKE